MSRSFESVTVIDTETTGFKPGGVVEYAQVVIGKTPRDYKAGTSLVNPGCAIELEAMAVHHLQETDVANAPPLAKVVKVTTAYVAAHNMEFDIQFLPMLKKKKLICTYRCARHLWPDAPSYKNQVLRYWLPGLNEELNDLNSEIMSVPPHRALPDAFVTAGILRRLLALADAAKLAKLTDTPVLLKMCGFGKHRGLPWAKVPRDYLQYLARQQDLDGDVMHTVKHWLA